MSRVLLSALVASAVASAVASTAALTALPANAGDRYVAPPPLVLSSDLSSPWTLQLKSAPRVQASRVQAYQPVVQRRATVTTGSVIRSGTSQVAARTAATQDFDPALLPATVRWTGGDGPGTIIVDTIQRRLFLVQADGQARRYAVGVGKPGFEWAGSHKVTRKATWPSWTPPQEMIVRERAKGRELPAFMEGGPGNPMGARALYLGSSIYRIHGTNQAWSIGKAVSSGCIRMRNEDVMDLYERVPVGAKVKVI